MRASRLPCGHRAGRRFDARSGMMRLRHQPIEIGAQRGAAVAVEPRAHPAGRRPPSQARSRSPRAAGGGDQPVGGRRETRIPRQLVLHPLDDARVDGRRVLGRLRLRLAIERGRPPVERAFVRRRRRAAPTVDDRSSSSAAAPKRSSKYSTSPSPTCSSTRSRGSSGRGSRLRKDRARVARDRRARPSGG